MKPGTKAIREPAYTIKEATNNIPAVENPNEVEDVIFQVGLNDFRKGFNAKDIQDNYLDMQLKYKEHFPNARQHITAIPPLANGHREVNKSLQKLSKFTESNYISAKNFQDKTTGKLRAGLMNGIHYNEWGIRTIAKETKKSLYSTANIGTNQLTIINSHNKNEENHPNQEHTLAEPSTAATPVEILTEAPQTVEAATPEPSSEEYEFLH